MRRPGPSFGKIFRAQPGHTGVSTLWPCGRSLGLCGQDAAMSIVDSVVDWAEVEYSRQLDVSDPRLE